MKTVSGHRRQTLTDNDVPATLKELFGSLAGIMTRDSFQVEINKRLGALLRVAGIDLQLVPHGTSQIGSDRARPNQMRLPLRFIDGDYDLMFIFGLAQLSERSKTGIYETISTILTDFLKITTVSGPVVLKRFRGQTVERLSWRPDESPTIIAAEKAILEPLTARPDETAPPTYEPPHNPGKFAHRLRNMLAAILSASSQLSTEDVSGLDGDDLLLIETIDKAATMQEELIKRYLAAYGPVRLSLRSIDFGTAVRSAVRSHDSQYGCATAITGEGSPTQLTSDAEILRQIIAEIMRNAYEASDGEQVTLRWNVVDHKALIMIKNHGEIDATDFESVFIEPFYTSKSGHAGLGLSIASRHASYLGGTVRGLSLHGYTIVTICLPITLKENNDQ